MSKKWKTLEDNAAKIFGTKRTPFSGSNSGITSSDTLADKIFVECKRHKSQAVITLMKSTAELAEKEGKIPILYLQEPDDRSDRYIVVHEKDFFKIMQEVDLSRVDKRIKEGTTIYDLVAQQDSSNRDIYFVKRNLHQRLKELFREKVLNKDKLAEIQSCSIIIYYIETIEDYLKEGFEK